ALIYIKIHIPSDTKWTRFLQYSTLVRHLCVDLSTVPQYTILVLECLIHTRPVIEVFPILETLHCKAQENVLYPSVAFLHSGVKRWILDVGSGDYDFGDAIEFCQMHNLTHVELGEYVTVDDLLHVFAALEVLQVETISFAPHSATYPVLVPLSRWPALKEIRSNRHFNIPYSSCSGEHDISCQLGTRAFPNLIALAISGCPLNLSKLLDDENFPFHVRSLTVEHMPCTDDPGPTYRKIVSKCPAVTEFVLHDSDSDSYSPFTSLRPFLSFRLTHLVVVPYYQISYDAVQIEELVRSLPLIEELNLADASRLYSPLGTFTFNHLPLFSLHCPHLTRLSVQLDASVPCNPSPPNLVPFAALRELKLNQTFIFKNIHDVGSAALLVSKLLPPGCQILCSDQASQAFLQALADFRIPKEPNPLTEVAFNTYTVADLGEDIEPQFDVSLGYTMGVIIQLTFGTVNLIHVVTIVS
ncbi:hypothetical protein H0H92_008009, partial [Tricholoma furcatifolium]